MILKKALGLEGGLYENRVHTQLCLARPWSYSHKAQPLVVKPNINSVEVHPQLSNNGPPVDGCTGGFWFTACWSCQGTLMYWIGWGLLEVSCVISKLVNYCSSPESRRGSHFGLARPFRRRMHVTRSRPCFATTQRHTAFLVSRVPLLDELRGGAREQEDERELNDRPHGGHRVIEAFKIFLWVFF